MIKSVRLTNFFSFRDCEITLEPDVTVLVGINGSGKTNLLRAFELLQAGMEGGIRAKVADWGGPDNIYWKGKNIIKLGGAEVHLTFEGDPYNEFSKDVVYKVHLLKLEPTRSILNEELVTSDGAIVLLDTNKDPVRVFDFSEPVENDLECVDGQRSFENAPPRTD